MLWKSALFCLALSLSAQPGAAAAKPRTFFAGAVKVTAVKSCDEIKKGQKFKSIYHIANFAGNDNFSAFSTLGGFSGDIYQLLGGTFDKTFREVDAIHYGAGFRSYTAELRLVESQPANIEPDTKSVTVTFEIDGTRNRPGCIATFKGKLAQTTNE